jgi:hypothetical protein
MDWVDEERSAAGLSAGHVTACQPSLAGHYCCAVGGVLPNELLPQPLPPAGLPARQPWALSDPPLTAAPTPPVPPPCRPASCLGWGSLSSPSSWQSSWHALRCRPSPLREMQCQTSASAFPPSQARQSAGCLPASLPGCLPACVAAAEMQTLAPPVLGSACIASHCRHCSDHSSTHYLHLLPCPCPAVDPICGWDALEVCHEVRPPPHPLLPPLLPPLPLLVAGWLPAPRSCLISC